MNFIIQILNNKIFAALIIVLVFLIVARIVLVLALKIFKKFHITTEDKRSSNKFTKPFTVPVYILISIVAYYALAQLFNNYFIDKNIAYRIVRSLIIFSVFWFLYHSIGYAIFFIEKSKTQFDKVIFNLAAKSIKFLIFIVCFAIVMQEWDFNITGILTGLGIGGLAVALAAQDTIANFFGSLMIMLDRPFSKGDWVKILDIEGNVEEVGFRSTKIRSFDQAIITVPNSNIAKGSVVNFSRMEKRKVSIKIGINYGVDFEKVEEFILKAKEVIQTEQGIHKDNILVYFDSFTDMFIEVFISFFTISTDLQGYSKVKHEINIKLLNLLKKVGISPEFILRNVYIKDNRI